MAHRMVNESCCNADTNDGGTWMIIAGSKLKMSLTFSSKERGRRVWSGVYSKLGLIYLVVETGDLSKHY